MVLMGALPLDLTLLFSRMDGAFRFTGNSTCLTIEMLDRRIGQRRMRPERRFKPGMDGGPAAAS